MLRKIGQTITRSEGQSEVDTIKIYGIDFTSSPKKGRHITCLECTLEGNELHIGELSEWVSFGQFEQGLQRPGPWIAGMDLPFGQSRTFIKNIGWPDTWGGYVDYVGKMSRPNFRTKLEAYKEHRVSGDKEHQRATDKPTGAVSPQKLYGVPVGLMFFEGAPRLRKSGVKIPGLQHGDPSRIVVEAYPGVLARQLIGRTPYKSNEKKKQTQAQRQARCQLIEKLRADGVYATHGIRVSPDLSLADDPTGDHLDALLCAIQAAWAWHRAADGFGAPNTPEARLEGWIADPAATSKSSPYNEKPANPTHKQAENPMITVHHLEYSRSHRILWLLEELELDYRMERYARNPLTNLAPTEYLRLHPIGKAPIVTDGDQVLAETGTIIEYILERYGEGRLKPQPGTAEYLRYSYWMHAAEGSLMPFLVMRLLFTRMETQAPFLIRPIARMMTRALNAAYIGPSLSRMLDFMETELDRSTWFAGDQFTAADIQMGYPTEAFAARGGVGASYPAVRAFIERVRERPAYRAALEKGGPLVP